LDMECACEEERSQSESPAQAGAAQSEVYRGKCEHRARENPPQGGPPQVDPGNDAQRVRDGCPQHGLARGLEVESGRRCRSRRRDHTAGDSTEDEIGIEIHRGFRRETDQGLKPASFAVLNGMAEEVRKNSFTVRDFRQRLKPETDSAAFMVSLKRYPDTNREFFSKL